MSHMYKHHHHHHYYCQRQNAEETTAHVQNISPHVTHNVDPFTSNTTKLRNVDLSTENTFQHQENAHKRKSFYLPSTFVLHEFSTWPLIDLDTTNVFFLNSHLLGVQRCRIFLFTQYNIYAQWHGKPVLCNGRYILTHTQPLLMYSVPLHSHNLIINLFTVFFSSFKHVLHYLKYLSHLHLVSP